MTDYEMFEKSFERPKNYFKLNAHSQWKIDKELGILDWTGDNLSDKDKKRFTEYYQ